ncbi:TolC family protein [Tundrisphaera sp. TA3]|uniref:TolC family protein n=1 Tax=Tundrisphaera sp. TA3 TaxID=3435775 RepID=UPI003EB85F43
MRDRQIMASRRSGRAAGLLIGLVITPGCVQTPPEADRRVLEERIVGAGLAPHKEPAGPEVDTAVRPARAEGPDSAAIAIEPLSLEQARAIALRQSPILAQSNASVDIALGNREIADAGFYPTIQGNYGFQAFSSQVGFTGTRGRFPVLPVRGFGPGTQDFHVTEAQLKWTIFQFGKQITAHEQAGWRAEVAKLERERACQTVGYEVAQAYFRILEAKSDVEIAARAVDRAEAFAKEAGDLLRRGVITREEELRAEAGLAGVRQVRADAVSAEEVAIAALNRAMGISINADTRVVERREAPQMALTLDQCLRLAVAHRREIPVVSRGIAIAQGDVKVATADFLPSLSIQAGYSNVTGTGVQNANVGAGGIFVSHDLFAGGKRRGQLHAAEAGVRSAAAQAQQVCDGIAFEVNVAYRGLEDARERIGSARAVFEQARENTRLLASRARAGDATPADVIEAESGETRSEQTFHAAIYQYQRAIARLEYAIGVELPATPGRLPEAASPVVSDDVPPVPPDDPSPFERRSTPNALPGLPPPPGTDAVAPIEGTPLSPPPLPEAPDRSRLFGPPSLARPPYESSSPFGTRP